jgi:hypothetical protein
MAQRRMFSLKVIDTDIFLDMPMSARLLYYDLSMRADDDGFVSSPKKIQRMIGASDDDLRLLAAKQFIIPFESGICVIKHWRIHNYIRSDRYSETVYLEEKQTLTENNGQYEINLENRNVIPMVNQMDTQVRLGKDRLEIELGKESIELDNSISKDILVPKDLVPIQESWNSLGLSQIKSIQGNRLKLLRTRLKEHGMESILQAIENVRQSSFLKGQNKTSWIIVFDWFIKPNNFPKVLEGNYDDKENNKGSSGAPSSIDNLKALWEECGND